MPQVFGTPITVAIGASSVASAALGGYMANTYYMVADVDCYIVRNGTATTTSTKVVANQGQDIGVQPGDTISVIRDSADGTLFLTPLEGQA